MKLVTTANDLALRSGDSSQHSAILWMQKGTEVTLKTPTAGISRWVQVETEGRTGFVARRYLAQVDTLPVLKIVDDVEARVSSLIASLTSKHDSIKYRLGCKAKYENGGMVFSGHDISGAACSGTTVDCSGWIFGLVNALLAQLLNDERPEFLSADLLRRLVTHSDGQICNVGLATGGIWTGETIDSLPLHGGMLIGLNNGDYDWEGAGRILEVDHIVMTFQKNGVLFITQSSSSGGGVNSVPWSVWRSANNERFRNGRVHAVSLFSENKAATRLVPQSRADSLHDEKKHDPLIAKPG